MQKYKTFLFDWDGCLAQTLDIWMEAYHQVFTEFGVNLSDETIASDVFGDWNAPAKQGIEDVEAFNKQLMSTVNQNITNVELYPGAKELLTHLHNQDKQLALLSSSLTKYILPALIHHGIADYFKIVLGGDSVQNHKPHPEVINKAVAQLQASRETSVMVGDSTNDLGAAANAQVDSVLFFPPRHQKLYDRQKLMDLQPTHVYSNFADFANDLATDLE